MTTNYSIECALPYVNDLEQERAKFEVALNGLVKNIAEKDQTLSRVLLVDDVTNTGGEGYDLASYTEASTDQDGQPTLVMRESMLNMLSDEVYAKMAEKLSPEDLQKLKSENGYSSPFYIAIWSLIRLGYLTHPEFPADQVSEKIVNILPEVFREGEEESMAIISKTPFAEAVNKVEYIYV